MPEIPEVQALADGLAARTIGLSVARANLTELAALKTFDPPLSALAAATVEDITRRGKFLIWQFSSPDSQPLFLAVHLSRAGWIRWLDSTPTAPPRPGRGPLALRLTFADSSGTDAGAIDITEAGTKKRLAIYVVADPLDIPGIARLGPEPLDAAFTLEELSAILDAAGGKRLKTVIRHQGTIAGIGNAYSDEILHSAKLSPFAASSSLTDEERERLFTAIRSVLYGAIGRAVGSAPETLKAEKKANLAVHGRAGQPCPVCGDVVREVSYADSSFQYCATCQTNGKVLADRRMSRLLK